MDYLSDSSLQKLHKLGKQYLDDKLPDFVKNADIAAERPREDAPLSVYGDAVQRQYPCHTKVATWLSCLYFWGDKSNGTKWASSCPQDRVAHRLEKAARYWEILPEVNAFRKIMKKRSSSPRKHMTDDDYALVVNYGNERVRRFPLVNAGTVKKAAANLRRFRISYPYIWRKEAATKTLKKAMELDVKDIAHEDLDYLLKASGTYPADAMSIASKLRLRANVFPDEAKAMIRKAANALEAGQKADINKLCVLLDGVDRHCKKYAMYNAGMPMPEEVCFTGITEKQAALDTENVIQLTTGNTYALNAIKRAGLEPFTVLDKAYISAVAANDKGDLDMTKVADILPTLPRDDAQLLEKALKAVGVTPAENEKTAARNVDKDFSLGGMVELLGKPKTDYNAQFALRHKQSVQDELDEKNKDL